MIYKVQVNKEQLKSWLKYIKTNGYGPMRKNCDSHSITYYFNLYNADTPVAIECFNKELNEWQRHIFVNSDIEELKKE
ncbi:MAG: hypothetical protein ACOCUI_00170 [bacterium]